MKAHLKKEGFLTEYSNLFVCCMGLGIVFFGLACIIVLMHVMSIFCRKSERAAAPSVPAAAPAAGNPDPQMVAAVSAALAEDLGTDPAGLRILSFKKL